MNLWVYKQILFSPILKNKIKLEELQANKLWFSNFYIFATQCRKPLDQIISLKYKMFTPSGCKD